MNRRVVSIDDQCDTCGARNVLGVCYGPALPVLCVDCIVAGAMLLARVTGIPPFVAASKVRRGDTPS